MKDAGFLKNSTLGETSLELGEVIDSESAKRELKLKNIKGKLM